MKNRIVTTSVMLGALVFLLPGVWAFGWPRSFYDTVATYPPYNLHLFHDLGAFQLGVGVALLGALLWSDALTVALLGGTAGMVAHFISHVVDRDLGGRASDPCVLGVLSLVVAAALAVRLASREGAPPRSRATGSDPSRRRPEHRPG